MGPTGAGLGDVARVGPDRGHRSALSRRRFVGAAVALGAAGTAVLLRGVAGLRRGVATAQDGATPPAGAAGPVAFAEPPVRLAENGVLATRLEAGLDPEAGPGRMAYEGSLPGPTLRLRPGDTLRIALVNNLGGDATNLHVHGMHVSPAGNGDNVFVHVMNGETFDYEYRIPADHPAGLFWYHPHAHGDSMQQVAAGLAGAIVVEGGLDDLPGFDRFPERLLVLHGPFFGPAGHEYLVNGLANPTIEIRPGQTQRWRLANLSANNFFNLRLDGHQLHRTAVDGNFLPQVWTADELLLGPGERADVLVQGGAAGTYGLRSLAWGEGGQAQPDVLLATVVAGGEAEPPATLPTTLIPLAEPLPDLSTATVDRRRTITFDEMGQAPYFAIDGKGFDPNRVDQTVQLGATEEWTVRNSSAEWHPFHIHVNDFQVMAINGEPQAPHYEDTTPVPPNGEIVVRTRFLDFPGKFVYHCHILGHEDAGMMGVVEVVDGGAGGTPVATPAGTPTTLAGTGRG